MLQTSKLQTDLPHLDLATLRVYNLLSDNYKKKKNSLPTINNKHADAI